MFELLRLRVTEGKITVNDLYDGNPGEIDFGLSYRGFELSGVDCNTYINTLLRKKSS